jgi:hypothetical protein
VKFWKKPAAAQFRRGIMSPRSSSPRKVKGPPAAPDIYVALLFVSVAALIVGCTLLMLEMNVYEWKGPNG